MVSRQKDAYTKAVLVIPACMIILTGNIHLLPEKKKTNKPKQRKKSTPPPTKNKAAKQ